jgi:hypothetical protein
MQTIKDAVIDLIKDDGNVENKNVDFKAKMYKQEKYHDFIKDIISFANASGNESRYIIIGIKDRTGQPKDYLGLTQEDLVNQATFQNLVREKVQPYIHFEFDTVEYHDKMYGFFHIHGPYDRPYVLKNDLDKIKAGDSYLRVNSVQRNLLREDYDAIYATKTGMLNARLHNLDGRKRELRQELLFIYLIQQAYYSLSMAVRKLHMNKKSFVDDIHRRHFTREKADEILAIIISFSVPDIDFSMFFSLLGNCKQSHYKSYTHWLFELQSTYSALKHQKKIIDETRLDVAKISDQYQHFPSSSDYVWIRTFQKLRDIFVLDINNGDLHPTTTEVIDEIQRQLDRVDMDYQNLIENAYSIIDDYEV